MRHRLRAALERAWLLSNEGACGRCGEREQSSRYHDEAERRHESHIDSALNASALRTFE
jgi:hypothetical protein